MNDIKNKKWELISRKKVYDGSPYIKISVDKVRLPSGDIIDDYHRIEVNNAVMLLVENDKNVKRIVRFVFGEL